MDDLADLVIERTRAKMAEDQAIAVRRTIDAKIAALLARPDLTEGTASHKFEDGSRVSVTFGVDRKLDAGALTKAEVWTALSPAARAAVSWKPDLSLSKFRALDDDDRAALAPHITSKPSTPSVKFEPAKAAA